MTKFINVVTVKVQNNTKKNYIKKIQNTTNFDGLISSKHIAIDFNKSKTWVKLLKAGMIIDKKIFLFIFFYLSKNSVQYISLNNFSISFLKQLNQKKVL